MATRRKVDMGALGARARSTAQGMAGKDRRREAEVVRELGQRATWPLDRISPRPQGDTRPLNAGHVVSLAESIEALGLIEPLVIDIRGRLLAGGHRLAACKLLDPRKEPKEAVAAEILGLAPDKERAELEARLVALKTSGSFDPSAVPVRVFDFDAEEAPERALAIETSENTQRRDYTRSEVVALYKRLIEAGYTDRRGKPRKGERAAKPVLATVIGRSVRTVRRVLAEEEASVNRTNAGLEDALKAALSLQRALRRFESAAGQETAPQEFEAFVTWMEESGLSARLSGVIERATQST